MTFVSVQCDSCLTIIGGTYEERIELANAEARLKKAGWIVEHGIKGRVFCSKGCQQAGEDLGDLA
jgi:hypothetical protein